MRLLYFFIAISLFFSYELNAQNSVAAAGGEAEGTDGEVSFSVGQVVYKTLSGTSGEVFEGVQLPYEISLVTSVPEGEEIEWTGTVFPIPAREDLTLRIDDPEFEGLSYQMTDVSGKVLTNKRIAASTTSIPISEYSSGIYFLRVMRGNELIRTFKIIKDK